MNNRFSTYHKIDKFDTNFFEEGYSIYEDGVMNKVKEEMSMLDFDSLYDEIDNFIDHEQ